MDTQTTLIDFITREVAFGRVREVGVDDELISTGILDSLGMMRLVLFIEEKLRIQIPDDDVDMDNFRTVRILATYLDRRRQVDGLPGTL
jgi:acyl carrier protein